MHSLWISIPHKLNSSKLAQRFPRFAGTFRSNRFPDLADTVLFFPQLLQSLSLSPAMRAIETTIAAIGTKIGLSERLPQLGKFTGEEYVRLTVKSIAARTEAMLNETAFRWQPTFWN